MDIPPLKNYLPHVGMRTFKTALAVVIGLFLSNILGLHTPLFVAIAAMTTMQPSVHETHKAVRLRMFTCVMGVVLGFVLALITDNIYLRPLIAGVGIVIIILTLLKFKMNRFINLTNIIFVASFSSQQSQLAYGVNRLIGTFLGIFVSIVINYLIARPTPKRSFESLLEHTYEDIFRLSEAIILADEKPKLDALQKELTQTQDSFELIKKEISEPFARELDLKGVDRLLDLFTETFISLRVLSEMDIMESKLTMENKLFIQDLFHYTELFEGMDKVIPDPIVNFHVHAVLEKLEAIQILYDEGVTHV